VVAGVGMIGGSLARALRKAGCVGEIVGVGRSAETLTKAARLGVIDRAESKWGGALAGAALGFLWFNTYPAQVFMGDVGALSLGAAIGMVAVLVRQELVLVIMGGVFVIETLSVIIQVASFKSTGRRIFRMAPLHHHFELRGWPEPRVIVRFWIVSLLLVLVGLATLKIR